MALVELMNACTDQMDYKYTATPASVFTPGDLDVHVLNWYWRMMHYMVA
jgi:hypothetical protein